MEQKEVSADQGGVDECRKEQAKASMLTVALHHSDSHSTSAVYFPFKLPTCMGLIFQDQEA